MKSLVKKSVLFFAVFFCCIVGVYAGSGVSSNVLPPQKKDELVLGKHKKNKKSSSSLDPLPAVVPVKKQLQLQDLPQEIRDQITQFSGLNDVKADRLPLQTVLRREKPCLQAVATLVAVGARLNITGKKDKQLPLSLSICSYRGADCMNYKKIQHCNTIFSYLLRHDATPEFVNAHNRTSLHTAVSKCNTFALAAIVAESASVAHCYKLKDHCNRDLLSIAQANLREQDLDICDKHKRACIAVAKQTTLHMVQAAVKPVGKKKKK